LLINKDGIIKEEIHKLRFAVQVESEKTTPELFMVSLDFDKKNYFSDVHETITECINQISKLTPSNVKIKSCWNCSYASHSPYVRSNFANIGCFKDLKDVINNTNDKNLIKKYWEKRTIEVSEVFLCQDWKQRTIILDHLSTDKIEYKSKN